MINIAILKYVNVHVQTYIQLLIGYIWYIRYGNTNMEFLLG